jgi:hypothetical protein
MVLSGIQGSSLCTPVNNSKVGAIGLLIVDLLGKPAFGNPQGRNSGFME